jgi:hypothetical protein
MHEDGGEEAVMLPFRGDDPYSTAAQKRRSGGSAGMANGSGAGEGPTSGVGF